MKMLTFERKLLNPQLRTWVFWWPAGRAVCWAGVFGGSDCESRKWSRSTARHWAFLAPPAAA